MKNEDRIVELLAESLKRQDRMVEQIGNMSQNIGGLGNRMDKVENGIERVVTSVNALADIVQAWTVTV